VRFVSVARRRNQFHQRFNWSQPIAKKASERPLQALARSAVAAHEALQCKGLLPGRPFDV
jgi:hypothetical protein